MALRRSVPLKFNVSSEFGSERISAPERQFNSLLSPDGGSAASCRPRGALNERRSAADVCGLCRRRRITAASLIQPAGRRVSIFLFFFPLSFIVNALLVLAEDALHDGAAEEEEYSRRLHC